MRSSGPGGQAVADEAESSPATDGTAGELRSKAKTPAPWSASASAACCLLRGSYHEFVHTAFTTASGLTDRTCVNASSGLTTTGIANPPM